MSLKAFNTQYIGDDKNTTISSIVRVFNSIQSNLNDIFTYINKKVQLDSVILSGISVKSGLNTIPHTLGRSLTGYQIISSNKLIATCNPPPTANNQALYLYLTVSFINPADTAANISLLVF
jgi:hypothetical protein